MAQIKFKEENYIYIYILYNRMYIYIYKNEEKKTHLPNSLADFIVCGGVY